MTRRWIGPAFAIALVAMPHVAFAQSSSSSDAGSAAALALIPLTMLGFFSCFYGFIFLFVIAAMVIWVSMIVDVAQRQPWEFPQATQDTKLMWLLIVILGSWIGATVYYFVVYRNIRRAKATPAAAPATAAPPQPQTAAPAAAPAQPAPAPAAETRGEQAAEDDADSPQGDAGS